MHFPAELFHFELLYPGGRDPPTWAYRASDEEDAALVFQN